MLVTYNKEQMSKYEYMNEYTGGNNNDYDNTDFRKSALDDIKKSDKGYYTWQKRVPGLRKSVKIEVYSLLFRQPHHHQH